MLVEHRGQYRQVGGAAWSPLFDWRDASPYLWDASGLPSGLYQVRIQPRSSGVVGSWILSGTFTLLPVLEVGGYKVEVMDFARSPDQIGGPGLRRAVNGTLRKGEDWRKKVWSGTAYCEDDAAAEAFRAACAEGGQVPVLGTAIDPTGAPLTCRVEISADDFVRVRATWYRVLSFTIYQV